jgi:hypothetical protein
MYIVIFIFVIIFSLLLRPRMLYPADELKFLSAVYGASPPAQVWILL